MKTAEELFEKYKHLSDGGKFLYLSQFIKALTEHDAEIISKIKDIIFANDMYWDEDKGFESKLKRDYYNKALTEVLSLLQPPENK